MFDNAGGAILCTSISSSVESLSIPLERRPVGQNIRDRPAPAARPRIVAPSVLHLAQPPRNLEISRVARAVLAPRKLRLLRQLRFILDQRETLCCGFVTLSSPAVGRRESAKPMRKSPLSTNQIRPGIHETLLL